MEVLEGAENKRQKAYLKKKIENFPNHGREMNIQIYYPQVP